MTEDTKRALSRKLAAEGAFFAFLAVFSAGLLELTPSNRTRNGLGKDVLPG